MRAKRVTSLISAAVLLSIASLFCFAFRRGLEAERTARSILDISTSFPLGTSTKEQVMLSASYYEKHVPFRIGPGTITFFVSGPGRTHTRMAISLIFDDDRLVGREVGIEKESCCSVSTKQVIMVRKIDYGGSGVALANLGNPHYLRFNIDPHLSSEMTREFFGFRTDCLGLFADCSSAQDLNRSTAKMLAYSGSAGYQQ